MLALSVALLGSVLYGLADFAGGLAARQTNVMRVVALSSVAGLAIIALTLPIAGGVWSPAAVWLGAATGVFSAAVFVLLYRALAIGPMGVLSPITAVVGAAIPVGFGLLIGEQIGVLGFAGILLALIAVVVISASGDPLHQRPSAKGLLLAFGCGLAIAGFFIVLSQTPGDSGAVPLVVGRIAATLLLGAAFLIGRRNMVRGSGWRLAVIAGALDSIANLMFLVSVREGQLAVVAVVTALYPAATVLCARFILKERLTRTQIGGLAVAAVAVTVLALQ